MRINDPRPYRIALRSIFCAVLLSAAALPAAACSVSVPPLAMGSINPLHGGDSDSATTLTVTCADPVGYSIALSAGSGSQLDRVMYSGANALGYNLYTDASHNVLWGDGSAGTVVVAGSDPGGGSNHTIYARVPAQPQAVPGSYGDSIVVTVSF